MLNQHNFSSPILLNIECCQILFMGMAVGTWEFEGHKEDCGLAIQLTWSPNTDLRVSTARTVPRSLWSETWNMIWKQHKNHINIPSVVESALSTVDRSAASRGAIEGAKPLKRDEPPLHFAEKMKVWKWKCESEIVKVWKWKCESVKVWKWKFDDIRSAGLWKIVCDSQNGLVHPHPVLHGA